ncbi:long-chain-fatty-acid--CoA ligase [Streptomyces poriferorum]|uniref:Long-chain fatty acid--CoA ligase n=1 Tax=Streptomyces poriferorum TaxID=2798799 RepID=A0ABY9J3K6_9ACTN|nr:MULTISPECIES: long-chain fatty acid--CoA ligase [unclassified Streptomyces]MDP5309539.1 long-chain fatty acid--CoA ligase [Streptomyces sp. Alt4]WLQ61271.1 long-chain fatty acid--CoA ligase [Streptomyces sp. Alt2]
MLNLSSLLEHSAREHPGRIALVLGDTRLTYAELLARSQDIAGALRRRGIGRGDRVALSCPNVPDFPAAYFGILRVGAVVVPLNVLLRPQEVAYHLTDSGARALLCYEGTPQLPLAEVGKAGFDQAPDCEHLLLLHRIERTGPADARSAAAVATAAEDTAVILYTSGTTGRPKGAELTHRNMVMNAMVADRLFTAADDEVMLAALPLFHAFGQSAVMNMGMLRGATLVLQPRFDAEEALRLMHREGVTFFAGVPTMYWALLGALGTPDEPAAPTRLRTAVSGGAALPVEVLQQFGKAFGVGVQEGYGLSETSPVACFNPPGLPPRPGSIGRPVWGVQMKLIDDAWQDVPADGRGEIALRGHNIMKGYYRRPDDTASVMNDGWFRTGDIARRDADGYYYVVDRVKDLIIRGGFNVYPREIEEVLITHPAVSMAAVVGVRHATHGEDVKAFVIPVPGTELSEAELIAWCRERMAAYKYPRSVEFRDSLPLTSTGKILKRRLTAGNAGEAGPA